MGGGYRSDNKNTVLIILIVIMAVVLGILMWGEKKKSNAKTQELTKLNEQIFAENQAKAEALKQKEAEDSFYQKLTDGQQWFKQLQAYLWTVNKSKVSVTNISMGGNASYAGYIRTIILNDDMDYDLAIIC